MAQRCPDQNRMQRRFRRTHERLLEAALAVFGAKGVDAATIEDITERADLGKGTFYRHFEGKGEVVTEVTARAVVNMIDEIRRTAAGAGSLTDVVAALLNAHTKFFRERREEFLMLFQGRLLVKLEREEISGLDQPFMDYLGEIEVQVTPFLGRQADPARIRRLACGLAGFVSGFLSFGMIGMSNDEIEVSLEPMRNAFVAASSALLRDPSPRPSGSGRPGTPATETVT